MIVFYVYCSTPKYTSICIYVYSEDRIRNGVKRILKSRQGATQGRLDTFFKPVATATAGVKRKVCFT